MKFWLGMGQRWPHVAEVAGPWTGGTSRPLADMFIMNFSVSGKSAYLILEGFGKTYMFVSEKGDLKSLSLLLSRTELNRQESVQEALSADWNWTNQ